MKFWAFIASAIVGGLLAFGFYHYWPQFVVGAFIFAGALAFGLFGLNNIVGWIEALKAKFK